MTNPRQVILKGRTIDLVLLHAEDATILTNWINDPEVTQFLGTGQFPHTLEDEQKFVAEVYQDKRNVILGIWHTANSTLIGVAGLHRIDQLHATGSFGIFIGDHAYWGNGYGSEALMQILHFAFKVRNLRNVTLSVLGNNPRGKRCYEKCGFVEIGRYEKHRFKQGEWHDEILMIAVNPSLRA